MDAKNSSAAAAHKLLPFLIYFGQRGAPRLSFAVMAPDAFTAHQQHVDLAEPGERVEVAPARRGESFPIQAERQALAVAELRETGEAARIRADLDEDVNKGARRFAMSYRRAIEDQVQHLRCVGAL